MSIVEESGRMGEKPDIDDLDPQKGSKGGGYGVQIIGKYFQGTESVHWGSTELKKKDNCWNVNEAGTKITVKSIPGGTGGATIQVKVQTANGTSHPKNFQYELTL